MKSDDIYKYIKQLESNVEFYKNDNIKLEKQIEFLKNMDIPWSNPNNMVLSRENYNYLDIIDAYNKTYEYEGIEVVGHKTILDTFIEFLNNSHHSLDK